MSAQFPPACVALQQKADDLTDQIQDLNELLKEAPKQSRQKIINQINALKPQLVQTEKDLKTCVVNNTVPPFGPPPQPTKPAVSADASPATKTKVISLPFLQKKFDDFFNKRTDPPLFKLRLHHHDHITGSGSIDNDPPNSDAAFSFIDAEDGYRRISFTDLGQLDHGYFFDDINSTVFNVNLDAANPAPLELKISFETDGPTEMPSTGTIDPDMKFKEFFISVRFTLGYDAAAKRVDLLSWVNDFYNIKVFPFPLTHTVRVTGNYLGKAIDKTMPDVAVNDFFDETFIQPVVHVHLVTTRAIDPGGAAQKSMRHKIFDRLVDKDGPAGNKVRDNVNLQLAQWLVGDDGSAPVTLFRNDGQNITISYTVPKNRLNPFPFVPANWPAANNPKSNPKLDFKPGALANIDHIIVLTKENRSFDHMLGFLSLPANKGGLGRTDVDGLKGGESNLYNGVTYPSFPFAPGQTLFRPNAGQNAAESFHQVDGGRMDGFVRSYAEEAGGNTGNGSTIMGFHNGANVPVYDALARDFGISHRWFATHPGPTFPNRFYELTGRMNLNSGLSDPAQKGFWEINNTDPLTPSLSKTVFDHLNDYAHIANVSWNYFEHFYCTLRFFENYTFDHTNIVDADDPVNGFFAKLRSGNLPSVSFIDPHFIDLPPHANCDEPPSDVKDGQDFVRRVVEAVVASPKWNKILLIITYDEHGGFYDHVPPPPLQNFPDDPTNYNLPVKTYGLRVPVFFVSPWVAAGSVFGHDSLHDSEELFFDNTSILKTIAKRFMSDFPPYMGPHYAVAKDLSAVMSNTPRQPQFLPFIRYNFLYAATQKMLDVQGANNAPGTHLWQWDKNGTVAQDFSFEEAGDGFFYIRTNCGNLYVTVEVPDGVVLNEKAAATATNFAIKQDVKYKASIVVNNRFRPEYQKWKPTSNSISVLQRDFFVVSNAFFPNKVLKCVDATTGGAVVLGDPDPPATPLISKNAWKVTSPLVSHDIVVK